MYLGGTSLWHCRGVRTYMYVCIFLARGSAPKKICFLDFILDHLSRFMITSLQLYIKFIYYAKGANWITEGEGE